jgi:hypothetical protein
VPGLIEMSAAELNPPHSNYMTPNTTMNNFGNTTTFEAKSFGNFLNSHSFCVEFSNFANKVIVQYRVAMILAMTYSAFAGCIGYVLKLRASEKMRWIYAGTVIALVKHLQSIGNFPFVNKIRKTMGGRADSRNIKSPVAMRPFGTCPNPALTKFGKMFRNWAVLINFLPESFFWRELGVNTHTNGLNLTINSAI